MLLLKIMCLNFLTGDYPCDYPWLRVPWFWPWEDGFTWPWEDAFIWPWEAEFCWPWEGCGLWPWDPDQLICTQAWEPIDEPECDVFDEYGNLACDAEEQPEGEPLFGIADTHAHPFSNLAFGGALLWGSPADRDGVNHALAWGDYSWDFSTRTGEFVLPELREALVNELPWLGYVLPPVWGLDLCPMNRY